MEDISQMLLRLNRLLRDLEAGVVTRNSFRPWEVELLLDIQACDLGKGNRRRTLRRYERAARKSIERGAARPLKLSEYLARLRTRAPRTSELTCVNRMTA